jgi:glycosyltransferase involved in cell wall biosynthesis
MNVALLNTFHRTGGAAIAASRLHRALNKFSPTPDAPFPLRSTLLTGAPRWLDVPQPETGLTSLADSFVGDKRALARMVAERYYFVAHERDKSVRAQFSPGWTGTDLRQHPAIVAADVIHLHWINLGMLSLVSIAQLATLGKPIVWTMHDMWATTGGCHYAHDCVRFRTACGDCPLLRQPGPRDLSSRGFQQKRSFWGQMAGRLHLIAPSHWMAEQVRAGALTATVPVHVIPNAIDIGVFRPAPRPEANARLGLPPFDGVRLLFGSLNLTEPRKGFALFAEALHRLHATRPDLKLEILILGSGEVPVALPYPVRRLGLLHSEASVVAAYNSADLSVITSLEDNLPNMVVESLACGTPVAGFPTGGIPDMIRDGVTGWLAAAATPEALVPVLLRAVTQPENLPAFANRARTFAAETFGEQPVAIRHAALYDTLLAD